MKKRKIIKCATLCAMVVIVLVTAILPTFAWTQSGDTAQHAEAVFTLNGSGQYFYDAYYTNLGEEYFDTNGDILLFTAPRLSVGNGNIQFLYQGEEASYFVYLNCDSNSGQWLFKIFDFVNGTWHTYNAVEKNIYAYYFNDYVPIIYNQNIENIMSLYRQSVGGKEFMLWSAFRIPDTTMTVIPKRYNNTIGYKGGYDKGYIDGHGEGLQEGIAQGFAQGQTDIINTRSTLKEFVSAIFTAPSHFISTIFDFNLFGYNVANIVRVIFTLLTLGLVVVVILKIVL